MEDNPDGRNRPTNPETICNFKQFMCNNISKTNHQMDRSRESRNTSRISCGGKEYNHALDLSRHPRAKQMRLATQHAVERMLEILRESDHIGVSQLKELKGLLEDCSCEEPICGILDKKGYDIVQRAVIKNSYDFLNYLLKKGFNVSSVKRACSSPLHLACKFGHIEIIQLLLLNKVDVNFRSTVCYPSYHCLFYNSPGFVHCVATCHAKHTPLHIALIYDKDDIVRILLEHQGSAKKINTSGILQRACQRRAKKCLAYLLQKFPGQVHQRDHSRRTLLAVAFEQSEQCGRMVLESVAQWPEDALLNCSGTQASLLHVLYRSHAIEHPYQISKLAHRVGFKKEYFNVRDRAGNTPLHLLLRQVGKKTIRPHDAPSSSVVHWEWSQEQQQEERDNEVFQCIKFLLEKGARLDVVNNSGEGVLHLLLRNDFYQTLYCMSTRYYYRVLPEINRVLEFLLDQGVEVNTEFDEVSSPLTWAAHVLCSMEAHAVESVWPQMWHLFKLLFYHGADPNLQDEKGISITSLLLTATNRWMTQCMDSVDRCKRILCGVTDLLSLFLDYDFKPSEDILDLCTKQIAILCNIALFDSRFLLAVRGLMLPFINSGINPNSLHVVTEDVDSSSIPCQLNCQFYLARAFIIHRQHYSMLDFFTIFETTLDQDVLNHLLKKICEILLSNFEDSMRRETSKCVHILQERVCVVRSLKNLCRITVCNCMGWKLKDKSACLPLPRQLTNYICDL